MKIYKLYDNFKNYYLKDEFGLDYAVDSYEKANNLRWEYTRKITSILNINQIISIHEFENGVFNGEIMNLILN